MTTKRCSECDGRNGDHEFSCAFATYDARDYVRPAESKWVAVFASGRSIRFTLGAAADEPFALGYAERRLVADFNAFEDGDVVSVRRDGDG